MPTSVPAFQRSDPITGLVSNEFEGYVTASGLLLHTQEGLADPSDPPETRSIRWERESDGAYRANLTVTEQVGRGRMEIDVPGTAPAVDTGAGIWLDGGAPGGGIATAQVMLRAGNYMATPVTRRGVSYARVQPTVAGNTGVWVDWGPITWDPGAIGIGAIVSTDINFPGSTFAFPWPMGVRNNGGVPAYEDFCQVTYQHVSAGTIRLYIKLLDTAGAPATPHWHGFIRYQEST